MAQRLVRARRKITNAGIPYQVPPPELLEPRLAGVLAVIYLVFNQGYSTARRHGVGVDGDRPRPAAGRADADRVRGARAARAPDVAALPARRPPRSRGRAPDDRGAGSPAMAAIRDRTGRPGAASRPRAGSVRAAGGHRRGPRDRTDRGEDALGPNRGPLRRAARDRAVARRGAEPRHRRRDARRTGRRPRPARRARSPAADVLVAAGGAGGPPRPGGPAGGRGAPLPGRGRAHRLAGGARRARAAAGADRARAERSAADSAGPGRRVDTDATPPVPSGTGARSGAAGRSAPAARSRRHGGARSGVLHRREVGRPAVQRDAGRHQPGDGGGDRVHRHGRP